MPAKSASRTVAPTSAFEACAPEHAFRFMNGMEARNLTDFRDRLAAMDAGTAEAHRGHYGTWMRDVLRDPEFAGQLDQLGARRDLTGDAYRDALVEAVRLRAAGATGAREAGEKKATPRAKGSVTASRKR